MTETPNARLALMELVAGIPNGWDELAADRMLELLVSLDQEAIVPAAKRLVQTWTESWRPSTGQFMDAYYAELRKIADRRAESRGLPADSVPLRMAPGAVRSMIDTAIAAVSHKEHNHRNGPAQCPVCGPHVGCREGKPCARCKELAAQIRAAVERRNAA